MRNWGVVAGVLKSQENIQCLQPSLTHSHLQAKAERIGLPAFSLLSVRHDLSR